MRQFQLGLTLASALLLFGRAAGQQPPEPSPEERVGNRKFAMLQEHLDHQQTMYEDIEVMRRLLTNKLAAVPSFTTAAASCTTCHQVPANHSHFWATELGGYLGNRAMNEIQNRPFATNSDGSITASVPQFLFAHSAGCTRGFLSRPSLEGVYLRGQGVVYAVTLPPPAGDPRPRATQPAPKPPTEWERVRNQIRGEKAKAEEPASSTRQPSLGDVLLKALADNGRHFTQLGENESLTVVVTFRQEVAPPVGGAGAAGANRPPSPGGMMGPGGGSMGGPGMGTRGDAPSGGGAEMPLGGPGSGDAGGMPAKPKSARDYELLGDLHFKQGQFKAAAVAYGLAYEAAKSIRVPEDLTKDEADARLTKAQDAARDLAGKLGKALAAAGELEAARKALNAALEKQQKINVAVAPPEKPKPPAQVPAKLIVSAPKKLLDQVGSGKMSLEAFKKEATVQYLTFPEGRKKP